MIEWVDNEGTLTARVRHPDNPEEWVYPAWCPQEGSQKAFLAASNIYEVLFAGSRGPGKTDALLMDFAQHVGKGFGSEWKGVLFRRTYPELSDVISKSEKWFPLIWPGAKFNRTGVHWTWPDGEKLYFRHMLRHSDYYSYHGHAYPWIAFEEVTTWPDAVCYNKMKSCSRSTVPGMPRNFRATTNPYGVGHNWVKRHWQLPQKFGRIIHELDTPPRVAIHGHLSENRILLHSDPHYTHKLKAAARNPSELAAWLDGDWDITSGGMFDDIWTARYHIVPSFPARAIPKGWRIDRSFDWGSSKPFAVLWFAESNGEPFEYNGNIYGKMSGDIYQFAEYYGCTSEPNTGVRMLAKDIARAIRDREDDMGVRVLPGPADASIFDHENGVCIATDMKAQGIHWLPADKGKGSRVQGWEMIRRALKGALPPEVGGPREDPGLFIVDSCDHTLRTVPSLSRSDRNPDDVNTETEDHIGDALRYRVRRKVRGGFQREM